MRITLAGVEILSLFLFICRCVSLTVLRRKAYTRVYLGHISMPTGTVWVPLYPH